MISHAVNHLKKLRLNAGLDVQEVASTLGISVNMVYKLEEGRKVPSIKLAIKMRHIYSCSLDDILLPYYEE